MRNFSIRNSLCTDVRMNSVARCDAQGRTARLLGSVPISNCRPERGNEVPEDPTDEGMIVM
jgi:hypothetical protein